jgi:L-iditol 2-dehydrogenase
MQAVVYRGPRRLRVETVPVPRIGRHELLVRVAVCGVCPTDIKKVQYGTVPPPRIFGHETAGTVVKVGASVGDFKSGDRVALHHHVPCQDCHYCRHRAFAQCQTYKRTGITAGFKPAGGGFAEYVRVMPFVLPGVIRIPRRNSFEEGAMLEPVNTVLKAVRRLGLLSDDVVLVAGQGPIGLMFTRLLQLQGVRVLATDLLPARLKLARQLGALWVERADRADLRERVFRVTKGRGLDAAVVAVPVDAVVRQSVEWMRGGAPVMLFAHTKRGAQTPIDLASVCVDEVDIIGSYSADVTLQREVARLVFSRRLDVRRLITHRFPLARTAEAVRLASSPDSRALKVVVSQEGGDLK